MRLNKIVSHKEKTLKRIKRSILHKAAEINTNLITHEWFHFEDNTKLILVNEYFNRTEETKRVYRGQFGKIIPGIFLTEKNNMTTIVKEFFQEHHINTGSNIKRELELQLKCRHPNVVSA